MEGGLFGQVEVLALFNQGAGDKVVEDMKAPLSGWGCHRSILLQVIVQSLDSTQAATLGELEFGVLSEPRGVGIEEGTSVAKAVEHELGGRALSG